ncbi:MAG: hypothetical protein ABW168_23910 [Sedimenticola sp.]
MDANQSNTMGDGHPNAMDADQDQPAAIDPKEDQTTAMPTDTDHITLSRHLLAILEGVGLSEESRKMAANSASTMDILRTLGYQLTDSEVTLYTFGSSSEGTTTPGLKSDTDILYCDESIPVVYSLHDAGRTGVCFLAVSDSKLSGYTKLQFVNDGIPEANAEMAGRQIHPIIMVDADGRKMRNHRVAAETAQLLHDRSGPAAATLVKQSSVDFVEAYRCRTFPQIATEWVTRTRQHNWPSPEQIHKMCELGCLFVAIGQPNSPEEQMEWRTSFSLQERELMRNLNTVQYKCYVLMKYVKKDMITSGLGDSISSYHCKTCLFYSIESTPAEFWTQDNLVDCLLYCLNTLLKWLVDGFCPNYFIRHDNMFERKVHGALREQLSSRLQELLDDNCAFLLRIRCDDVGCQLASVCSPMHKFPPDTIPHKPKENVKKYEHAFDVVRMTVTVVRKLRKYVSAKKGIHSCVMAHHRILQKLTASTTVSGHTEVRTRAAMEYLFPVLHTSMACHLTARLRNLLHLTSLDSDREPVRLEIVQMKTYLNKGLESGLLSCRLKAAALYYMMTDYKTSGRVLSDAARDHPMHVINVCECKGHMHIGHKLLGDKITFATGALTFTEAVKASSCLCVTFLPFEIDITPDALQYEMFKSVGTPSDTRLGNISHGLSKDLFCCEWHEWSIVDGSVFLCFMQYLVSHKVGDIDQERLAMENMEKLIRTDDSLSHKETAYNLLGWICKRNGDVNRALWCFVKSLRLEPEYNAAKWHIGDLFLRQVETVIYSRE